MNESGLTNWGSIGGIIAGIGALIGVGRWLQHCYLSHIPYKVTGFWLWDPTEPHFGDSYMHGGVLDKTKTLPRRTGKLSFYPEPI